MSADTEWFYKTSAWKRRVQPLAMRRPVDTPRGVCPPMMCERCFALRGELVPARFVHHIRHVTRENVTDPSVTLDLANLTRVCRRCHEWYHPELYGGQEEGRCVFDADGNVIGGDDGTSQADRGQQGCAGGR